MKKTSIIIGLLAAGALLAAETNVQTQAEVAVKKSKSYAAKQNLGAALTNAGVQISAEKLAAVAAELEKKK